jgi:transmembrane sensor
MDYSKFSVEDLTNDDYFIRWVNGCDQEAEKFWRLFISLHPEIEPRIREARILVLNLKRQQSHAAVTDREADVIWERLQKRIEDSTESPIRKHPALSLSLRIAAAITVVALVIGGVYLSVLDPADESKSFPEELRAATEDFIEEVNTGEEAIRIHLSDSSTVVLEKDSRLRYRKHYQGLSSRDVFLNGKAFFTVAKNPDQPFFVHANEVTTKVLGTSFTVKAYHQDKDITVTVTSGKVSVFSPKKAKASSKEKAEVSGVVLLPNQQVVYQRDQKSFEKTLVETPVVLSTSGTDRNFIFDNAPIGEVFRTLENAYGIDIIFDEEVMKNCFITAPLGTEPLFDKLGIICRTIGADYEIIDAEVVINSSGCQTVR